MNTGYSGAKLNELSGVVVDMAIHIHRELGPGLLESVYESVLCHELSKRRLPHQRQVPIPVIWDGLKMDVGFRADLIVDQALLLELKSLESLDRVHKKQLLTYLKLTGIKLGLLINFGSEFVKDGIVRLVNNFPESS